MTLKPGNLRTESELQLAATLKREQDLLTIIGGLVQGVKWWAAQEDGIPEEIVDAYWAAHMKLGWEIGDPFDQAEMEKFAERHNLHAAQIVSLTSERDLLLQVVEKSIESHETPVVAQPLMYGMIGECGKFAVLLEGEDGKWLPAPHFENAVREYLQAGSVDISSWVNTTLPQFDLGVDCGAVIETREDGKLIDEKVVAPSNPRVLDADSNPLTAHCEDCHYEYPGVFVGCQCGQTISMHPIELCMGEIVMKSATPSN